MAPLTPTANDSLAAKSLMSPSGKLLALLVTPEAHPDHRGSVRETYRQSWFPAYVPPIRQLVQSNSKPGTLRGMHLHRKQWDIWRFTSGEAVVRLVDHASLIASLAEQRFLLADKNVVLAIPPGISHGFYTEPGCTLMYALSEEYDGTDEFGWFPFDGLPGDRSLLALAMLLGDRWPRSHDGLHISERDLRAPRLAEFVG